MVCLVEIKIVLRHIDDTTCNVGAMVRNAFEICEQIRPNKAGINRAVTLLHTQNMIRAEGFLEIVYDLFKRLDLISRLDIVVHEGIVCEVGYFLDRRKNHFKFLNSKIGKLYLLFLHFLGRLNYVKAMV